MTTINPWINFNGNAEEAFTFYKSILGGEFTKITRFKDIASSEFPVNEKDQNKLISDFLSGKLKTPQSKNRTTHQFSKRMLRCFVQPLS